MSPLPKSAVVYQVSFPDGTWYIGYTKNGYKRQQEHYQPSRQHNERLTKRLCTYPRSKHKWKVLHHVQPEEGYEVERQTIEFFWNQPGRLNLTKKRLKPKQKGTSCTVDGIRYDSINDLRRRLFPEFGSDAISTQVKAGCTCYSEMLFNLTMNTEPRKARSVQINGVEYSSYGQAAAALGVSDTTVRRMVRAKVNTIQEYQAYKKAQKRKRSRVRKTAGSWNGIKYDNIWHFAEQLGWTDHHARELLKSGVKNMEEWREHLWQKWLQAAKRKTK